MRKASSILLLGLIFKEDLKDQAKALNYAYRAKSLFDSIHQTNIASISAFEKKYSGAYFTACENIIGSIYTEMNQLDSAQYYLQLAYRDLNEFDMDNFYNPMS